MRAEPAVGQGKHSLYHSDCHNDPAVLCPSSSQVLFLSAVKKKVCVCVCDQNPFRTVFNYAALGRKVKRKNIQLSKRSEHFSLGFVTSGKGQILTFRYPPWGGKVEKAVWVGGEESASLPSAEIFNHLGGLCSPKHAPVLPCLPRSLPVVTTMNSWLATQRKWHLSSCAWLEVGGDDHQLI